MSSSYSGDINQLKNRLIDEADFIIEKVGSSQTSLIHRSGIAIIKINELTNQISWAENDMAQIVFNFQKSTQQS